MKWFHKMEIKMCGDAIRYINKAVTVVRCDYNEAGVAAKRFSFHWGKQHRFHLSTVTSTARLPLVAIQLLSITRTVHNSFCNGGPWA